MTRPTPRLSEDPRIRENLTRLAAATGCSFAELLAVVDDPAPDGITPARWYSANLMVGRTARPLPPSVIQQVHDMAAPHLDSQNKPAA